MGRPGPQGQKSPRPEIGVASWNDGTLAGFPGKTAGRMLGTPIGDSALSLRGQQDIDIYRNASPSVVIVQSDDGPTSKGYRLGSGSYIGSNQILTNAHVVGSNNQALIAFKPTQEGAKVNPTSIVAGQVLHIDRARDLALLSVSSVPAYVRPLALGNKSELQVGADVYAIGHPTGEAWTFTRGLISQLRNNYEWKDEHGQHRADVIQTQTPINVGNSGGPLIGASGKMLGVNSFKTPQSEGLNFAVSVEDVNEFLNSATRQAASNAPSVCKPVRLYDGRNKHDTGHLVQIDTKCRGVADMFLVTPDDVSQPIQALIDTNGDGKVDVIVDSYGRDNRWNISFWDTKFNGKIDVVGFHPDGKINPSRYEKYDANRKYAQTR